MANNLTNQDVIAVRGARQNTLKEIDVDVPKNALTVVTGVSGSGKSSLAFETLYAEGQRRYVESFSTYARQFLERMDRPDVDSIEGLIPAVAIEQRNSIRSARSTLGTLTELNDYLKVLFAHCATLHCRVCGEEVKVDLPGEVIDRLCTAHQGRRAVITFPFHLGTKDEAELATAYLTREGYHRAWSEDKAVSLATFKAPRRGSSQIIADRVVLDASARARLVESVEAAYRMGQQRAAIHIERDGGFDVEQLSATLEHCQTPHPPPRAGLFSFSSPLGACPTCNGFGRTIDIDLDRVIPDPRLSLSQGAIKPWTGPKRAPERRWLREVCADHEIDMHTPWQLLSDDEQAVIIHGPVDARRRRLAGIRGWFDWLKSKSYKMHVRILLSRYRAYIPCEDCGGQRFQPESLLYRLGGLHIADVLKQSVSEMRRWLATLTLEIKDRTVETVLEQLSHRLLYLERVGLGYLSPSRAARTLSGGEVQRANLTTALGSGLVNTMFVLDEPTIGLHARDTERLTELLHEVAKRDNTVVIVEHDPDILRVADQVVDLGPGPGAEGGHVVFAGPPAEMMGATASATAKALRARQVMRRAADTRCDRDATLSIHGAAAWNLKNIDVHIPIGRLTVLTGVSGSGKSTLLETVLYRGTRRARGLVTDPPGEHRYISGLEAVDDVHWIDQASPAASPRANPATYVKAWDGIRKLFARQPLARRRGYTPGTFSFNSGKGRCPACEGAGHERIEMQFLSDVFLVCSLCEGKRFIPEVLEVTWSGLSIADMLALSVDQVIDLLPPNASAHKQLKTLSRVGLGYLSLGQPLATLSGGEAQRLKIAHHLGLAKTNGALFLLDEPTTGLHLSDVDRLIMNLEELVAAGNTVVVVEHHLDVIASADHVIELGPEGGDEGGEIVFTGPPAELVEKESPTGPHLKAWLKGLSPLTETLSIKDTTSESWGASESTRPAAQDSIEIVGARMHNLKSIDLTLPRTGRTVISGISGSGKSTLAFDIIFAEGQRRFLDCLSPFARQYLNQLSRPEAERIAGIPPTVAIEQRTTRGGARSIVANATEIEPFLRILFARVGVDPKASGARRTPLALALELTERFGDREVAICAPMVAERKGFHKPVFSKAARLGMTEVLVDGILMAPSPAPRLRRHRLHSIDWVLGRTPTDDLERLIELIERAAGHAGGSVRVLVGQGSVPEVHGPIDVAPADSFVGRKQFDPRLFSPHTRIGACEACGGAGVIIEDDIAETCPVCHGERLGPEGRRIRFGGYRLPELLAMTPPELLQTLGDLDLDERGDAVAQAPLQGIKERATFLVDVGLDYLQLNRPIRSLSGGEAQRIRLAAQLGAHLSGVLYVLDEPTIGLHPTDTEVLLSALDRLQARGNGVLMVEHDEATLRTADIMVDIGPGAGEEGGEVLVAGTLRDTLKDKRSLTGRCLRQSATRTRDAPRTLEGVDFVTLHDVTHHNLKDLTARIPRGRLTVVSGVSGSGKSSLIHDVLTSAITDPEGTTGLGSVEGHEGLERVVRVDDKPIGKNPRSIPATYIGIWDTIRKLFSQLPESRLRGFGPARFSFNVKGGRCEACKGQGVIKLEMSFLPDAFVQCDSCLGRRFSNQTLQVTYDGHSIYDVLQMPVRQALTTFERVPKLKRALQMLVDVGLGYLRLGQPSTTLSGGEAQRIKLVSHLLGRRKEDVVIILDEPSVGLHMADVPKLLEVLHRLVDDGSTVVVIEHNVDILREADWVIDLGPGGGPEGGTLCYEGRFDGLIGVKGSRTGQWLARQEGT